MSSTRVLIVFAKAPCPGRVKTRLAAELGSDGAMEIYRRMAEGLWAEWTAAQRQDAFRLWLCFDPPEAEQGVRAWLEGADRYLHQASGNLGRRIARALEAAFNAGFQEVAVVGTDAPATTPALIVKAFSTLEAGCIVLGPTLDGGFHLMALPHPIPGLDDLLEEMPWSSSDTLAALVGGARSLGFEVKLLPEARDIDTLADLEAYRRSPENVDFPL